MHFFWSVKNLFLNECYIFVELYYFEWVEDLKCLHCFLGYEKNYFQMDVIFNIMQTEMGCLHSCQLNTTRLLSVSNGLGQVNPPY